MKKDVKKYTNDELLKDIVFLLNQSMLIEHKQDYEQIAAIRKKYNIGY